MTEAERLILKTFLKKEVRQGFDHRDRIAQLYMLIRDAAINEFTEDNALTIDAFLRELFESTQYQSNIEGTQ